MNKKKILVVDDDAVIIKALTVKLQAGGFEVVLTGMRARPSMPCARKNRI